MRILLTLFALFPTVAFSQIIWSEDFGNGFNSPNGQWTVSGPDSAWKHSLLPSSGEWSGGLPQFNSATYANGYALFDADSLNFPFTPNYYNPVGYLTSPTIDLSNQPCVSVDYTSWTRTCCGPSSSSPPLSLDVSGDGGNSWTAFPVTGLVNSSSYNPLYYSIDITSIAANNPNVQLRFTFDGGVKYSHYFWKIDDIAIIGARNTYDTIAICNGDSYFVGGALQNTQGTYVDSMVSGNGCDSIVHTYLDLVDFIPFNLQTLDSLCLTDDPVMLQSDLDSLGVFSGEGVTGNMFDPAAAGTGTHWVYVSYTYGLCTEFDSVAVFVGTDCSVGIEAQNEISIALYPNPNNGEFVIEVEEPGNYDVELINAVGQVVWRQTLSNPSTTVMLDPTFSGVYFVRIIDESGAVMLKRILVER